MGSPNGSIHTTHTPPPLSFYNTFKAKQVNIEAIQINFIFGPSSQFFIF